MKKLLLSFFTCLILFSCYGVLSMEASTANMHKETVTIHNGDTLWHVASKWANEGEDVREVIYRIEQENKLSGKDYLQPGQTIVVPVRNATVGMVARK